MSSKSHLVSGMGVALSLIQTLVSEVRKAAKQAGLTEKEADEQLHRLATAEADATWAQIVSLVLEGAKEDEKRFCICEQGETPYSFLTGEHDAKCMACKKILK